MDELLQFDFWLEYEAHLIWAMLLLPPLLVFSAGPDSHLLHRIARLILAVGLFYALLYVALNVMFINDGTAIEAFRDQNSGCHLEACEGEPSQRVRGVNIVAAQGFGWIGAMAYVGLWEYLWRKIYRYIPIKDRHMKAYKFVSAIMIYSFYVTLVYLSVLLAISLPFVLIDIIND